MPVSSYATSTPVDVKTRSTVDPLQDAPAYSALHMLTVNVWPAPAITPHTGSLLVSVLVWLPVKSWHDKEDVGASVGMALGRGVGCVGAAVGSAEGTPGGRDGLAVGIAEGT